MTQEEQQLEVSRALDLYMTNEGNIACLKHRLERVAQGLQHLLQGSSDEALQAIASIRADVDATQLETLRSENRKLYAFLEGQGRATGLQPPG